MAQLPHSKQAQENIANLYKIYKSFFVLVVAIFDKVQAELLEITAWNENVLFCHKIPLANKKFRIISGMKCKIPHSKIPLQRLPRYPGALSFHQVLLN